MGKRLFGKGTPTENKNTKPPVEPEVKMEQVKQKGGAVFTPFDGDTKKLDEPKLDKKGRVLEAGQPKFYVERVGDTFKFISIYKNGKGISRRLVRTIKPKKKGAADDVALMRQLHAMKIPGSIKV